MPMKQTILFLGAIFGMLGTGLADEKAGVANVLTDAEKAEGWSLLFDGKDLFPVAQLSERRGCERNVEGGRWCLHPDRKRRR